MCVLLRILLRVLVGLHVTVLIMAAASILTRILWVLIGLTLKRPIFFVEAHLNNNKNFLMVLTEKNGKDIFKKPYTIRQSFFAYKF